MSAGADTNSYNRNNYNISPSISVASRLLERGGQPNTICTGNVTPLMSAGIIEIIIIYYL